MYNKKNIQKIIEDLLKELGQDLTSNALIDTPNRVASMYEELLGGYAVDIDEIVKTFDISHYDGIVIAKEINFYSMCEHHMLPFYGICNIGYIPKDNKILGLSKFYRIVDAFSRRLQTQERLTEEIAETIIQKVPNEGCLVSIEANHMCISMRGAKKDSVVKTIVKKGRFSTDEVLVSQFLSLI